MIESLIIAETFRNKETILQFNLLQIKANNN